MRNLIWPIFVGATVCALGAMPRVEPKFSFSESIRRESMTVSESFGSSYSTETRSVTVGKMTFHAEVPMTLPANLPADTTVSIKVGDFTFSAPLKDDAKYQPGRDQARLAQRVDKPGSTIRTVNGTVNLKWGRDKLTVDIESKDDLAAHAYVENVAGEAKGEVSTVIELAGQKVEATVPFSAKIRRKTGGSTERSGEVLTIDVKGRL